METVSVDLGSRSYDISIAEGLRAEAGAMLSALSLPRNVTIITNTTIAPLYLQTIKDSLARSGFSANQIVIPDGEHYKTLAQMQSIYEQLLSLGIDRNCPLIALGGGVIGDITGFAAATFLRGVPFVQIPTTLLSQVDSSVGGKTGVNLPGGKNMVGAFYQPEAVIIDPLVLRTLDKRELRAGMAEVIKYGIISDVDFFADLEQRLPQALALESGTIAQIIQRCCSIKASITSRDETEKGIRSYLNFGHTLGHAIETLTGYHEYIHGEAVGIGMVAAARLSSAWGFCPSEDVARIAALVDLAGLPAAVPDFSADEYADVMLKDKKKAGSNVKMVLLNHIGEVFMQELSRDELQAELQKIIT